MIWAKPTARGSRAARTRAPMRTPGLPPQGRRKTMAKKHAHGQRQGQQVQPRQQRGGKGVGPVGPEEKDKYLLIGGEDQAGQLGDGVAAPGVAHAQVVPAVPGLSPPGKSGGCRSRGAAPTARKPASRKPSRAVPFRVEREWRQARSTTSRDRATATRRVGLVDPHGQGQQNHSRQGPEPSPLFHQTYRQHGQQDGQAVGGGGEPCRGRYTPDRGRRP